MISKDKPVSGETLYRAKRTKFIRYCAMLMLGCMALGAALGYFSSMAEDGALPGWIIITLLAATWVLAGYLTWDYFRRTDELDVADNLWAALFSMYFYIAAFPSWFILNDAEVTGPPDQWAIWIASMSVGFIVYLSRKLGLR